MAPGLFTFVAFLSFVSLPTSNSLICYFRVASEIKANGLPMMCPTGFSFCYSFSVNEAYYYAGCSMSSAACTGSYSCRVCSSDYCNSMTPSSISCYIRASVLITQGTITTCATGVSTCFSETVSQISYAGCGRCSKGGTGSCTVCSSSLCNTWTPSSISCYVRANQITRYLNLDYTSVSMVCPTGISSCYSYTDGSNTYADCGTCSTDAYGSCVNCGTSYCNTLFPSAISCYTRNMTLSYIGNNGLETLCPTGVTSCYQYTVASSFSFAGCGVCGLAVALQYGCKTCGDNFCNAQSALPPALTSTQTSSGVSFAAKTATPRAAGLCPAVVFNAAFLAALIRLR